MSTNPLQLLKNRFSEEVLAPIASITEVKYKLIVKNLIAYSKARRPSQSDFKWEWLMIDLKNRSDLKLSTMNTYRAALLWETYVRLAEAQNEDEGLGYLDVHSRLKAWLPETKRGRARNGIPETHFVRLHECLVDRWRSGSDISGCAASWLLATRITGLRPSEWMGAAWQGPSKLVVINGKVKICRPANLRMSESEEKWILSPHSERTRSIPIEDPEALDAVRDHMERYSRFVKASFQLEQPEPDGMDAHCAYYDAVRAAILRACKRLWGGPKYSLYSARQQFNANCRAEFGPERTAALMGHHSAGSPSAAHYPGGAYADASARSKRALRQPMRVPYFERNHDSPAEAYDSPKG